MATKKAKNNAQEQEQEQATVETIAHVDPVEGVEGAETAKPRKRGPYKKRNTAGAGSEGPRKRSGARKADAESLGKQIAGIHQMLSIVTGFPELAIAEGEGKMLAEACISVADEYGLAVTGKAGAAIQLFAACSLIYGPRAIAINNRIREQRAASGVVIDGETE